MDERTTADLEDLQREVATIAQRLAAIAEALGRLASRSCGRSVRIVGSERDPAVVTPAELQALLGEVGWDLWIADPVLVRGEPVRLGRHGRALLRLIATRCAVRRREIECAVWGSLRSSRSAVAGLVARVNRALSRPGLAGVIEVIAPRGGAAVYRLRAGLRWLAVVGPEPRSAPDPPLQGPEEGRSGAGVEA